MSLDQQNADSPHSANRAWTYTLLSFGSHSGPPMLPVMYNNNYEFMQTDDYVMILAEIAQDAPIIRQKGSELMLDMQKWIRDSIGYSQVDTLVV